MKRISMFATAIASVAVAAGFSPAASLPARAADLVIALKEPTATMDPHFMTSPQAGQINSQIFEPLIVRDGDNKPVPKLAESWEIVNDTTWVFKLRKNVKFSDGTPFTAHDVIFTYGRAPKVPNAPSSFATYLNQVDKMEAVDDHTLRITTKLPAPTLLENLCVILIVSKKHGEGATTDDYNSGKAQIGTGPYKFVSWSLNDNTVIERNPNYWGPKPEWDKVTYRMIQVDSSRVAGLLSGSLDVIQSVPPQEIARLKAGGQMNIYSRETSRIAYIAMDGGIEAMAGDRITGPNGEKLDKNPMADLKVRQALRLAVDLDSFISKIYQGEATANGQFLSSVTPAYNPDIKPWKQDLAAARKLLEESGWAGKFKIDLGVAAAVFQNAVPTAEGIAQSWTRIGVPTTVSPMPYPVFLGIRNERKMPVYLMSYQNQSGSAEFLNPVLLHTREGQWGSLNMSRYSNKEFDKLVEDALKTMDFDKRQKLLKDAAVIVERDAVMVPLFFLSEATATKKTIDHKPRLDRYIMPADFTAAKAGAASTAK